MTKRSVDLSGLLALQRGVAHPHLATRDGLTVAPAVLKCCWCLTLHTQNRHLDGSRMSLVPFGPSPLPEDMGWKKPMITLLIYYSHTQDAEQGTKPSDLFSAQIPRSFGPPD